MFCTPCVIEMPTYGISPSWDYGVVWQSMLSWTAIDIAESSCMPTLNPVACRRWIQLHADPESSCMPTLNPVACRRWIQLHADAESSCMPTLNPVACRRWIQLHADTESSCMPTYATLKSRVCVCYYECCFTTMATCPAFVGDMCTVSYFAHAWRHLIVHCWCGNIFPSVRRSAFAILPNLWFLIFRVTISLYICANDMFSYGVLWECIAEHVHL